MRERNTELLVYFLVMPGELLGKGVRRWLKKLCPAFEEDRTGRMVQWVKVLPSLMTLVHSQMIEGTCYFLTYKYHGEYTSTHALTHTFVHIHTLDK